jgi:hypothetical protein
MDFVAESIDSAIKYHDNENMITEIGNNVEAYMIDRPLFTIS